LSRHPENSPGTFANYTRVVTEGNYGGSTVQSTDTLPNFVPEFANLGLSYNYRRLSLSGKWNYKSRTLFTYSSNAGSLRYVPTRATIDLNLRFVLTERLSLYADVINLTREPVLFERGVAGRIDNRTDYGQKISFGISGRY